MKRKISIPVLLRAGFSLVLSVGTQTFIQPCIHEDGNYGSCHNAGLILCGIGAALFLLALTELFVQNMKIRKGLAAVSALLALVGTFVPGNIVPLCMMNTMRCNLIMRPASLVLLILIILLAVGEVPVLQYRSNNFLRRSKK